jgi:hypothetical protein
MEKTILEPLITLSKVTLMVFGFLVVFLYCFLLIENVEKNNEKERFDVSFCPLGPNEHRKLEYNTLNQNVNVRSNLTMIAGTIFVSSSAIILAESARVDGQVKFLMVSTSLTLYALWLLCNYCTARKIDRICYARMRKIEESLGLEVHHYVKKNVEDKIWYDLRQHVWLIFFLVLLVVGILII